MTRATDTKPVRWRRWKQHGRAILAGGLALLASPAPGQAAAQGAAGQGTVEQGTAGQERIGQPAPQRLVSLNLCTDQLLIALADRGQIAGLSPNATDQSMSAAADQARGLPRLSWSAEEILAIDPDLVLGMPASGSAMLRALPGRHYPTLDVADPASLEDILARIEQVAQAIGQGQRGRALMARMRRDLAGLPKPGRGRVAAYYQRGGFLAGSGTLVDELMERVGLVNLARQLGKGPLARLSIEELVAARPDFLLLDSDSERMTDLGTDMLRHPALAAIPRLYLPQAWTVCGGPAYVDAARRLAAAVGRP